MVCQARIPFLVLYSTLLKSSFSCSLACSHERRVSHAAAFCTGVGVLIAPSDFLALTTAPKSLTGNSSSIDTSELCRPQLRLGASGAAGRWCLLSHVGREQVRLVQKKSMSCKFIVVDVCFPSHADSRAWCLPQFFKGETGADCTMR